MSSVFPPVEERSLLRPVTARARVIIDNDFSGDPDNLFQLSHHLLSPSVDIRLIVGSHLPAGDFSDPSDQQAENAAGIVRDLLARVGRVGVPVVAGSNTALAAGNRTAPSEAVDAIIAEAMADDSRPLFYCAGAGLTDLASALETEPRIAERLTLVWVGGEDHPGITGDGLPKERAEWNVAIDIAAAAQVFETTSMAIWQIPRGTYARATVSFAELDQRVGSCGELGEFLAGSLQRVVRGIDPYVSMGETYALGDQPLVLLTALLSSYGFDTESNSHVDIPRPRIDSTGGYGPALEEATVRVFTRLDNRLMFEDMFAKLRRHAKESASA